MVSPFSIWVVILYTFSDCNSQMKIGATVLQTAAKCWNNVCAWRSDSPVLWKEQILNDMCIRVSI